MADLETLAAWEAGKERPSWKAVQQLAKLYRRPVAALLMAEPPAEQPLPPDFRRLPDARKQLSPKTRFAIRSARWLAATAAELERDRGAPFGAQLKHLDKAAARVK